MCPLVHLDGAFVLNLVRSNATHRQSYNGSQTHFAKTDKTGSLLSDPSDGHNDGAE